MEGLATRVRHNGEVPEFLQITSVANPRIKEIRALLRTRKTRGSGQAFAGEGLQLLTRALTSAATVKYVVASDDAALHLPFDLQQGLFDKDVACYRVPDSLFERISRRSMSSGIAFVAHESESTLETISDEGPVVVLDRVSNPRNIGAIARTCEAAGFSALVLTGSHVDPYSYESLRASMGSVFGLPIISCSEKEMLEWVALNNRVLVGTSGSAKLDLWDTPLGPRAAIMFGNEAEGLSQGLIDACDELVKIPFNRSVDSLNLGAAVAVVAFEYRRRNPL